MRRVVERDSRYTNRSIAKYCKSSLKQAAEKCGSTADEREQAHCFQSAFIGGWMIFVAFQHPAKMPVLCRFIPIAFTCSTKSTRRCDHDRAYTVARCSTEKLPGAVAESTLQSGVPC